MPAYKLGSKVGKEPFAEVVEPGLVNPSPTAEEGVGAGVHKRGKEFVEEYESEEKYTPKKKVIPKATKLQEEKAKKDFLHQQFLQKRKQQGIG